MAGLLGSILMWPFLPVRAVVSLAEVLRREAEQEMHGSLLRRLEDLDEALRSGEISAAEHERAQEAVLNGTSDSAGDRANPAPEGGLD